MIDYAKALNSAQFQAATVPNGNTLVVAGAGTGKTRTIVYRLAWLVEQGVLPASILLLTFTRKAAREMLHRAEALLDRSLGTLTGGTFHAFAYGCLRSYPPDWLEHRPFTLMDSGDINQAVKACRDKLKLGKKDTSFPRTPTIVGLLSKSRNKEVDIPTLLLQDSPHLLPYAEAIESIGKEYANFRRENAMMDYDDLLFELADLLRQDGPAAMTIRCHFSHIMVDEYQDTNRVQARLVQLLAHQPQGGAQIPSVMAVGDEAQSIYAFRGADVQNILDFPKLFPPARIIRLEQNYRSTQPILDVANGILANCSQSFRKSLFTDKSGGELPRLSRPMSDMAEASLVTGRVQELLTLYQPHEIAVLFRAGYHSYAVENALRKAGIAFRKYGGLRFEEAAHVKDVLAFARLAINPQDCIAFSRIACMHRGIGSRTQAKLHNIFLTGREEDIRKAFKRCPSLLDDLHFLHALRGLFQKPRKFFENIMDRYRPKLEELYPDDWPSRLPGLEEILSMVEEYANLDIFMADLALEIPESNDMQDAEDHITLSTVHSAKGLEWRAVLLLDAVEDRFPSRHALVRQEDFEEERRLFYVACTRAKQHLDIYAPSAIYNRGSAMMVRQSPFLEELPAELFATQSDKGYQRGLYLRPVDCLRDENPGIRSDHASPLSKAGKAKPLSDFCRHRIFGRGKILAHLGNDRVQVDFPGFGIKIILSDYLLPED